MKSVAERVGSFPHDSPEWHAARASGIGASEIAAVVGLSPYESRFSLWHRKAGLIGPQPVNELMSWGHYLEPAIARRFADEHPELRVQRTGTWRSRARPWQVVNPDRLAYLRAGAEGFPSGPRPVEVKWSPYADGWGPSGTEETPVYYRCQVLWQLDALGAPFAYLAALVGSEYREYRIDYDPEDVELLRNAGQAFMDSLDRGEAPDIDDTGHTYQALRELHPDIDGETVQISQYLRELYRDATGWATRASAELQRAKNELLAAMGTARYAEHDGERIARRQPSNGGRIALYEVPPPKPKQTIKEATTP